MFLLDYLHDSSGVQEPVRSQITALLQNLSQQNAARRIMTTRPELLAAIFKELQCPDSLAAESLVQTLRNILLKASVSFAPNT